MLNVILIVAVGALACLGIAFTPLSIVIRSSGAFSLRGVSIRFSWMHPWVLEGSVALPDAALDIKLLRRFRFGSSTTNAQENQTSPGAAASGPDPVKTEKKTSRAQSVRPEACRDYKADGGLRSGKTDEAASLVPPKHADDAKKNKPADHQQFVFSRMRNLLTGKKVQLVMFFLRQTGLYGKLFRWLGRSLRSGLRLVFVHSYSVSVRAGTDDPAETGRMYGAWMGFRYGLPISETRKRRLSLEPVFDRQCLEIDGWVRLQSSVARLVRLTIIALVTFPYLSTVLVWRNSRKLTREGGKKSEAS